MKVLDFAKENNISLDLRDISEPENGEALLEKGGKQQVPFLVSGDMSLYESDAIIAYLTKVSA